jgi:hypothetical protein
MLLTNVYDSSSALPTSDSTSKLSFHKPSYCKIPRNSGMKNRKVVLLGDSHLRGCSEKASNLLGESYSVLGITKPNSNFKAITLPSNLRTDKYSVSDVIVVCDGNFDVGRSESKIGIRHHTHFVKNNNNTIIIMLDVLHRYDLDVTSCVNKEVTVCNMFQKVMKRHQHTNSQHECG